MYYITIYNDKYNNVLSIHVLDIKALFMQMMSKYVNKYYDNITQ